MGLFTENTRVRARARDAEVNSKHVDRVTRDSRPEALFHRSEGFTLSVVEHKFPFTRFVMSSHARVARTQHFRLLPQLYCTSALL